ncbi:hypothetical protein MBM_08408 [Drepanopeziza brunnea f. sp. 'multigermtubi' MB_m1]|uniref:Uncharacterized protein n=1 Tax=Marssonina brunnea f. sp. multigermtubi (strain MB_m1) TaxID=1072389 RepID=K1W837_MARBU|nr:uncharacterized protein MBM_08408 [Drepanopeziza brunnea f. sp. 'multigermtubi' MB_m1]EKD13325.1 hypothetical protein MBM_08408 [Drepanopeziza brunnea f. sp. 'multigermtubi' MB_m1]
MYQGARSCESYLIVRLTETNMSTHGKPNLSPRNPHKMYPRAPYNKVRPEAPASKWYCCRCARHHVTTAWLTTNMLCMACGHRRCRRCRVEKPSVEAGNGDGKGAQGQGQEQGQGQSVTGKDIKSTR